MWGPFSRTCSANRHPYDSKQAPLHVLKGSKNSRAAKGRKARVIMRAGRLAFSSDHEASRENFSFKAYAKYPSPPGIST